MKKAILCIIPVLFFLKCQLYSFDISDKQIINVDISRLSGYIVNLDESQKNEQLKDLALTGLLYSLYPSTGMPKKALSALAPLKFFDDSKASLPGRFAYAAEDQSFIILPDNTAGDPLYIGMVYDNYSQGLARKPKAIFVYSFSYDPENYSLNLKFLKKCTPAELTGEAYGYVKTKAVSSEGLNSFIQNGCYLTEFGLENSTLTLCGRKNPLGSSASLTKDELISLYKCFFPDYSQDQEDDNKARYETDVEKKVEEVLSNDKKARKALERGEIDRKYIIDEIKKRMPYVPLSEKDADIGFSIDPEWDYAAMARELEKLAKGEDPYAFADDAQFKAAVSSSAAKISSAAAKVSGEKDTMALLKLHKEFNASKDPYKRQIANILQDIELRFSFQKARYDGGIQGTLAGMILFYTDLTAKLWAFDYQNLAPKGIVPGFLPMPDIRVKRIYWDDFLRLSKTRLWFGIKKDAFDIKGGTIYFNPVSTRIFAASSDPLKSGKETDPNYQSSKFIGWWDRNYFEVSKFEPYYFKMNEIQKWSLAFTYLKLKKAPALSFLGAEKPAAVSDFYSWYDANKGLRAKVSLPKLDNEKLGQKTECLSLLRSRDYPVLGQNFFLSGGVSLASKSDIEDKLGIKPKASSGKGKAGASSGKASSPKKSAAPPRTYGSFKGGRTVDGITTIYWENSQFGNASAAVRYLADAQDKKLEGYKNENIFNYLPNLRSLIRISAGNQYLIKTQDLKEGWLVVSINSIPKKDKFDAKMSGSEPDADVFYSKIISEAEGKTIMETPGSEKLFP